MRHELQANLKVDSAVTEIVNNMFQIKCLHLEDYFLRHYRDYFQKFISAFSLSREKSQRANLVLNIVFTFSPFVLVLYMASSAGAGLSAGELFVLYSFFTTLFAQGLIMATNVSAIEMLKASLFYLNDLLDEGEVARTGSLSIDGFATLEADQVGFRYSNNSPFVLKNVSFQIAKGQKTAIVGASGCGKTTLVKIITGLYRATEGQILINGINIKDLSDDVYNRLISVVPQIPVVLNKTIRNNVTLDDPNVSEKDIIDALRTSGLWEEVRAMKLNLDTVVSGQGGNLSGGQIQRLSLARAIVKSPELVVLDEATSSLDPLTEAIVYRNLKRAGVTQLVISHRFSTVMDADQILVMQDGQVVEAGTHEELLDAQGKYFRMFVEEKRSSRSGKKEESMQL